MNLQRSRPRISLNKLGEYLGATPQRRRQILADQKFPRPFVAQRYGRARAAVVQQLVEAPGERALIEQAVLGLSAALSDEEGGGWQAQDDQGCLEALLAWMSLAEGAGRLSGEARRCPPAVPRLAVRGLEVSVAPELLVRGTDGRGRPVVGAWKLYFSKRRPLGEWGGLHAATALHRWAEAVLTGPVSLGACRVIDVFAGEVWEAPRHRLRRWQHLEVVCEEIAQRWPALPAPSRVALAV